jgi:hypothetical protein
MKRFSLKFLFAVSTVLIVFLGYSQWRRHKILSLCRVLAKREVTLEVPAEWRDYVWQRVPSSASAEHCEFFLKDDVGMLNVQPDRETQRLLDELGIADCTCGPVVIGAETKDTDSRSLRTYDQSLIAE